MLLFWPIVSHDVPDKAIVKGRRLQLSLGRHLPFSVKRLEVSPSVEGLVVAGSERCSLAKVVGSVQKKNCLL